MIIDGNVDGERYKQQALKFLPLINSHNHGMIFMHDGARPHTATTTRDRLAFGIEQHEHFFLPD